MIRMFIISTFMHLALKLMPVNTKGRAELALASTRFHQNLVRK